MHTIISCDLLKIHYLCGDKDNLHCVYIVTIALWFAQNSLPLRWQRQHMTSGSDCTVRCDLLKIHYLCGDKDNAKLCFTSSEWVVICSKFITFAVTKTTKCEMVGIDFVLWFAQNSLPLRWQRQLIEAVAEPMPRCDLLKIHYLCGDKDNRRMLLTWAIRVVICSKFITFAVTKTTYVACASHEDRLWFAQNSLPLRGQRQPT